MLAQSTIAPPTMPCAWQTPSSWSRCSVRGQYKNASQLTTQIGISKNVVSELLSMLNKPVREIARLLFDVK